MKCLILAAGYATRLYPLTENFPKPLLEVSGKTILDWLVDDLAEASENSAAPEAATAPASGTESSSTPEADGSAVSEFIVISNHRFAHHFEN